MENDLVKSIKTILTLLLLLVFSLCVLIGGIGVVLHEPDWKPFVVWDKEARRGPKDLLVEEQVKDGIHQPTGLIAGEGLELVVNNCTNCHSAKLIIQNRGDQEHWEGLIRWMQQTQGLWDLGENKKQIVAYLAKNYAPERNGRRVPLTEIEWYELEE